MTKEQIDRLKIACEIARAHLFVKPGDVVIRTEAKCGKVLKVQRVNG